jgi:hypothetical protein
MKECVKGSSKSPVKIAVAFHRCIRQSGTHVGKTTFRSSWRMRLDLLGSLYPPFWTNIVGKFKKSGKDIARKLKTPDKNQLLF